MQPPWKRWCLGRRIYSLSLSEIICHAPVGRDKGNHKPGRTSFPTLSPSSDPDDTKQATISANHALGPLARWSLETVASDRERVDWTRVRRSTSSLPDPPSDVRHMKQRRYSRYCTATQTNYSYLRHAIQRHDASTSRSDGQDRCSEQ